MNQIYYNCNLVQPPVITHPPVWDDLRVPVSAVRVGAAKIPGFTQFKTNGGGSTGNKLFWFDPASEEQVYFVCQIPHKYMLGSMLSPHVHWVPKSNGVAGKVVNWGLEYNWIDIGGTFGNTSIISGNVHIPADASLVASRHYLTELPEIVSPATAGRELSSMLVCRLYRDAAGALRTDDYTADAGLMEFDFHIQIDTDGSNSEFIK